MDKRNKIKIQQHFSFSFFFYIGLVTLEPV